MNARRSVVITGAAGEIGRLLAQSFASDGDDVHLVDIAPETFALAALIGGSAHRVDVTDEQSVGMLASIDRVDVLINGVGAWPQASIDDLTVDMWRRTLDLNLTSAFLVTKAFLPALRRTEGAVVNISSAVGIKGSARLIAYATAKAGLIGFTKSLAQELGGDGVRVNSVAPGLVDTAANRAAWGGGFMSAMRASRPLSRDQQPDDVVGAVRFLASDAAAFMTGQTLVVDGGIVTT